MVSVDVGNLTVTDLYDMVTYLLRLPERCQLDVFASSQRTFSPDSIQIGLSRLAAVLEIKASRRGAG